MSETVGPRRIPGVTICAADCQTPRLAARSLELSLKLCRFDDAVLFSDTRVEGSFRHQPIERIGSMDAYQDFTTRKLGRFISTSHVLMTQWDGYVVDPDAWDEAFLEYDYIGAVWPRTPPGSDVGNSGFSLQSRKLLTCVAAFRRPPGLVDDLFICRMIRPQLERAFGIRFAPAEVANRFSHELPLHAQPTFGFHGLKTIGKYLSDAELPEFLAGMPASILGGGAFGCMLMSMVDERRFEAIRMMWRRASEEVPEAALAGSLRGVFSDKHQADPYIHFIQQVVSGAIA